MRITLSSIDQRAWRGAAAVRILRWPRPTPDAPVDERLLGFMALGKGNELIAQDGLRIVARSDHCRCAQAAAHFEAANDMQALAEAEYQRGYVEFNLLYEFARRPPFGRSIAGAFHRGRRRDRRGARRRVARTQ